VNTAFGDTFYFLALLSPTDEAHPQAQELSRSAELRVVTTAWVVTEVADGLAGRDNRYLFEPFWSRAKSSPLIEVVAFSNELFEQGIALYADRPDKHWSLTDCISFVVMRDRGLTDALTGDRHFEQAGFKPLLTE